MPVSPYPQWVLRVPSRPSFLDKKWELGVPVEKSVLRAVPVSVVLIVQPEPRACLFSLLAPAAELAFELLFGVHCLLSPVFVSR
jgi:hypothetical protein